MVVSYIIGGHEKVQAALVGGIKLRARVFLLLRQEVSYLLKLP